jgi:hypothetical protein
MLGNVTATSRHDHDLGAKLAIAGASGMAGRKKTARRPQGVGFLHDAQRRILFRFLVIWLAALSLFDSAIDPNFP